VLALVANRNLGQGREPGQTMTNLPAAVVTRSAPAPRSRSSPRPPPWKWARSLNSVLPNPNSGVLHVRGTAAPYCPKNAEAVQHRPASAALALAISPNSCSSRGTQTA